MTRRVWQQFALEKAFEWKNKNEKRQAVCLA